MRSELRPHQVRALDLLRASLGSGKRRPVLQLPTGAGKTVIGCAVVSGALAKGNRVGFVVPAISLIDQTVRAFHREGITDVGVVQADHELTNPHAPVQVCSIQTLQRRAYPGADVVLVDECHKLFKAQTEWMADERWRKVPFVGLSATPWTSGLGKHYDDLLVATTTQELIDQGYLSPFRVFGPASPDLTGVKTVAGDYHEGQLAEAMDKPDLTADIVSTWTRLGENRPTLVFAVNRAHARHIQADFERAGVPCGYVDAHTTIEEREDIRQQFHDGRLKVVSSVGCLTTGVDWDVRCIVLARPTQSDMLFVQMIGRGLRTADGKGDCLILDHSDTHQRLGVVTDVGRSKLCTGKEKKSSGGTREKRQKLPSVCSSCSFIKPAGVHECPSCGFAPKHIEGVAVADGELTQIGGKTAQVPIEEKRRWYAELLGYQQLHNKNPKFAVANYKNKFGVWPDRKHDVEPREPSPEVLSYLKSRQIAWAKRQQRQAA
ncbi:MAG: DEAD/DEAH box helicase [Roseibium sp.]|nr:DEAD/DEAH box helicase [Roseibium sp.]